MKKFFIILTSGFLMSAYSQESLSDSFSSLSAVMARLKSGNEISITALGGSITTGYAANPPLQKGWAAVVNEWWQKKAEETGGRVVYYNAGVSGTDSAFAAARLKDHILDRNPDLVFLEFAMNDQWLDRRVRERSYEGIIRSMLKNGSAVFSLFVNEKNPPYRSNQEEQQKICSHYGIPYISWKDCVSSENDGTVWNTYFNGAETIHPNDAGHASIAGYITQRLDELWNSISSDTVIKAADQELPEALEQTDFETVMCLYSDTAVPLENSGWIADSPVHDDWARIGNVHKGWTTADPDAKMSFKVTGVSVGIMYAESNMFRNAEAWIEYEDGTQSKAVPLACYNVSRNGYLGWYYRELVHGESVKTYIVHIGIKKSRSTDNGKSANITGILVTGAAE